MVDNASQHSFHTLLLLCPVLAVFTSVTGLSFRNSWPAILFPPLKWFHHLITALSMLFHMHSIPSATSFHRFTELHAELFGISLPWNTWNILLSHHCKTGFYKSSVKMQRVKKIVTFATLAQHSWGSNIAHTRSRVRPLMVSTVANLFTWNVPLARLFWWSLFDDVTTLSVPRQQRRDFELPANSGSEQATEDDDETSGLMTASMRTLR
jgi:hypothetical protein